MTQVIEPGLRAPSPALSGTPRPHAETEWLADLATPCYVFDPHVVLSRHARLRQSLGTALVVSLKANPDADLFARCGHAFSDGIELASQGELDIVVGHGTGPKYLNNPAMSDSLIRAGLASRCRFILDNPDVVRRFVALAAGQTRTRVLLRLNVTGLLGDRAPRDWKDHFGMTPAEAVQMTSRLVEAGICVGGLHAFAGSGSLRLDTPAGGQAGSVDIAHALADLAHHLEPITRSPLTQLSLGGGVPVQGPDESAWQRYRDALAPLGARFSLAHESGRAVFAEAGTFVVRVVAVKPWEDRTVVVCDGGMSHNFLLARTESALKKWQRPRLVPGLGPRHAAAGTGHQALVFVGNTCNRADVIGRLDAAPFAPQPGDFVLFDQCGAYNPSYTVTGFLSHQPAKVYIRQA